MSETNETFCPDCVDFLTGDDEKEECPMCGCTISWIDCEVTGESAQTNVPD